ncbi:hypothetical protein [Verminephrobacter aporrectodeae]|uniref:hypothetical protein n=1 Tax=Verminephrobacter aporrectodeae TaxID=1110389 RepID=UPI0022434AC4|nr:hypothetical protein [Verminephrobacter aporrectodeae]
MPDEIKPTMGTSAGHIDPAVAEANPTGVIDQDEPLDDRAPVATATFFKVLIHDINWDFVDKVVVGGSTARAVPQSTPSARNPDSPWNAFGLEAIPNGVIAKNKPLDDESPAATTAFMVLVYDKDWDFVAKVVVAATARIVTLHANPATSNDYWAQDGAGTWVNLSSARYDSKMMIEGGQLRLDIPTIHGGPFDAGRAAVPRGAGAGPAA